MRRCSKLLETEAAKKWVDSFLWFFRVSVKGTTIHLTTHWATDLASALGNRYARKAGSTVAKTLCDIENYAKLIDIWVIDSLVWGAIEFLITF